MTLKEFVTLINRQEEIAVLKQGKDCDAKKLADIFENSCNTDTSGNELLCSKIKNNISKVVSKISRPAKGRLLYYSILGGNFG